MDGYCFGFQGQEKDDEIKGSGNSINYKYRMHDPRIGRFFAVDPLAPKYPHNSPYAFSENRVIDSRELEGLERWGATEAGSEFSANSGPLSDSEAKERGFTEYSLITGSKTIEETYTETELTENFDLETFRTTVEWFQENRNNTRRNQSRDRCLATAIGGCGIYLNNDNLGLDPTLNAIAMGTSLQNLGFANTPFLVDVDDPKLGEQIREASGEGPNITGYLVSFANAYHTATIFNYNGEDRQTFFYADQWRADYYDAAGINQYADIFIGRGLEYYKKIGLKVNKFKNRHGRTQVWQILREQTVERTRNVLVPNITTFKLSEP